MLLEFEPEVELFRRKGAKLDRPINIGSPAQLSILLYDILKYPIVDRDSPRGTGKEILKK